MAFRPTRKTAVGLAELTSANGTTRTGAALRTDLIGPDGLVVQTIADLTTSSVTATFTPQVSDDGTNWFNWKQPQAPAQVVVATGTGAQVVTRTALHIDKSVKAYQQFRCNALLGGATTAAADLTTVTYKWTDGLSV
jgi:hypothetical protein